MTKCVHTGCGNEAKWMPVMLLRPFKSAVAARAMMNVPTCDDCKAKSPREHFITPEGLKMIGAAFSAAGKRPPVVEHSDLTWIAIDSKEACENLRHIHRASN